jgi:hypothetical protein
MNDLQNFSKRLTEIGLDNLPLSLQAAMLPLLTAGWDDSLDLRGNLAQAERWLRGYSAAARDVGPDEDD